MYIMKGNTFSDKPAENYHTILQFPLFCFFLACRQLFIVKYQCWQCALYQTAGKVEHLLLKSQIFFSSKSKTELRGDWVLDLYLWPETELQIKANEANIALCLLMLKCYP